MAEDLLLLSACVWLRRPVLHWERKMLARLTHCLCEDSLLRKLLIIDRHHQHVCFLFSKLLSFTNKIRLLGIIIRLLIMNIRLTCFLDGLILKCFSKIIGLGLEKRAAMSSCLLIRKAHKRIGFMNLSVVWFFLVGLIYQLLSLIVLSLWHNRSTVNHLQRVLVRILAFKGLSILLFLSFSRPAVHVVKSLLRDRGVLSFPLLSGRIECFFSFFKYSCVLILDIVIHLIILLNNRLDMFVNNLLVGWRFANIAHLKQLISLLLLSLMHESLLVEGGDSCLRGLSPFERLLIWACYLRREVLLFKVGRLLILLSINRLQTLGKYRGVFRDILCMTREALEMSPLFNRVNRGKRVENMIKRLSSVINRTNKPCLSHA